jgi:hypothetical protein
MVLRNMIKAHHALIMLIKLINNNMTHKATTTGYSQHLHHRCLHAYLLHNTMHTQSTTHTTRWLNANMIKMAAKLVM